MLEQPARFWWALLLVGLVAGAISGALGVGSGIVFIPVLILPFAMDQKSAKGTAPAAMVPMVLPGEHCGTNTGLIQEQMLIW